MVRVKNLNGTSILKPRCKCESWLEHWERNYGSRADGFCNCCGEYVGHSELVGGHVKKVGYDYSHYIIPICKSCNGKDYEEFDVHEYKLVSANCDDCINK